MPVLLTRCKFYLIRPTACCKFLGFQAVTYWSLCAMYIMLHGSKDNTTYLKCFILPEACNILGRYPSREESEEKESVGRYPWSLRLKNTGLLAQIKAQLTRTELSLFWRVKRTVYMNFEVSKTGISSEKDVRFSTRIKDVFAWYVFYSLNALCMWIVSFDKKLHTYMTLSGPGLR